MVGCHLSIRVSYIFEILVSCNNLFMFLKRSLVFQEINCFKLSRSIVCEATMTLHGCRPNKSTLTRELLTLSTLFLFKVLRLGIQILKYVTSLLNFEAFSKSRFFNKTFYLVSNSCSTNTFSHKN